MSIDLLQKRYLVIADYPLSPFGIGTILFEQVSGSYAYEHKRFFNGQPSRYPSIFRPLEWWEMRDEKDLPKYVKTDDIVFKVAHYSFQEGDLCAIFRCGSVYTAAVIKAQVFPATEKDYNNYIKSLKQTV